MNTAEMSTKNKMSVVVAIEPISEASPSLNAFAGTIRHFQEHGLLPTTRITSMIHSALYMVPLSWYAENEERYAAEARRNIEDTCLGKFEFNSIQILKGRASSNQYLVEQMSENLSRTRTDLFVVLSNNRTGIPHWFLGSFAETAALAATCPVLIIKPNVKALEFSSRPRLAVALDASAQYSPKHIQWIVDLALPANAQVDLVSIKPSPKKILSSLRKPVHPRLAIKEIKKFDRALKQSGIETTLTFLKEKESVAATIASFADRKKSWALLTIATNRKATRRILIGSTARRVLALTKRPFFSLRLI